MYSRHSKIRQCGGWDRRTASRDRELHSPPIRLWSGRCFSQAAISASWRLTAPSMTSPGGRCDSGSIRCRVHLEEGLPLDDLSGLTRPCAKPADARVCNSLPATRRLWIAGKATGCSSRPTGIGLVPRSIGSWSILERASGRQDSRVRNAWRSRYRDSFGTRGIGVRNGSRKRYGTAA